MKASRVRTGAVCGDITMALTERAADHTRGLLVTTTSPHHTSLCHTCSDIHSPLSHRLSPPPSRLTQQCHCRPSTSHHSLQHTCCELLLKHVVSTLRPCLCPIYHYLYICSPRRLPICIAIWQPCLASSLRFCLSRCCLFSAPPHWYTAAPQYPSNGYSPMLRSTPPRPSPSPCPPPWQTRPTCPTSSPTAPTPPRHTGCSGTRTSRWRRTSLHRRPLRRPSNSG